MKEFNASECMERFRSHNIFLTENATIQFRIYHAEILKWNSKANLISKKDESRIVERHFLESALLSLHEEFTGQKSVLDLGTGAGFPGVPLKIVCPELKMTLLDSKRWKCLFLKSLIQKLGLAEVEVLCERAEKASQDEAYRRKFDVVVSRAVTELKQLFDLAEPFCASTAVLIALKGSMAEIETERLKSVRPDLKISVLAFPGLKFQKQKAVFVRKA